MFQTRLSKMVLCLIAANAVLLLLAVVTARMIADRGSGGQPDIDVEALSICIGVGTGQACLLGAYLACSNQAFGIRLRWFTRLIMIQWCCFVIPLVPSNPPNRLHWEFPWCVLVDQLLVAIAAFFSVGILRLASGRGVSRVEDSTEAKPRSNLRILDLLWLISLVAVFLSVAMRFKGEPMGFEGIIYAVMVIAGLYVGSPIGAILPFFLLGYLSESRKAIAITALVSYLAFLVGLVPFLIFSDRESRMGTLFFSLSGMGLVITNTLAFRFLCYRFRMLPCSPKSQRSHQVTLVAEESSNA